MGDGLLVFPFLTEFSHLPIRSNEGEQTEMPFLRVVQPCSRNVHPRDGASASRELFKEREDDAQAYFHLQCLRARHRACRLRDRPVGTGRPRIHTGLLRCRSSAVARDEQPAANGCSRPTKDRRKCASRLQRSAAADDYSNADLAKRVADLEKQLADYAKAADGGQGQSSRPSP